MNFYDQLQKTITNSDSNRSVTENGAVGFKTTGRKLLDLNFAVSSLRSKTDSEVERMFADALADDFNTAIVWLFFARDVRGGLGERRLFRVAMKYLAREFPDTVRKLLPLIAEYGRWDDLLCLMGSDKVKNDVISIVKAQLTSDMASMKAGKSVSLLAKWMYSLNTSSENTRKKAEIFRRALGVTPRQYRLMLSNLRRYIDVTERKMSANQWEQIKYEAVPSRANLNYNSAFLRHDEARRRAFLGKVENGEAKINASVLFPHDIVHKYKQGSYGLTFANTSDQALEAMWKALPNTVKDGEGTIVVADGSGSMSSHVGNTDVSAWEVAHALAIYFAERLPGAYKDQYITFSEHPQLVRLGGSGTLLGKIKTARSHSEVANTNIEAVFELILATAVQNGLRQSELPKNILIISDMEFDACATTNNGCSRWDTVRPTKTLFNAIARRYHAHGYQLPRLVFWNVNSRTGTIPVKENDLGVALVSGFSPNVAKMVMSGKLDPMDALLETLNAPRYNPVREALR
jgi:hypothetical protein